MRRLLSRFVKTSPFGGVASPGVGLVLFAALQLAVSVSGCATAPSAAPAPIAGGVVSTTSSAVPQEPPPPVATASTVTLAGARCASGKCVCRRPGDDAETVPPAAGMKRFEIRISSKNGEASLDISGIGSIVASGDRETCAYVDVPAGSTHDAVIAARESRRDGGVAPEIQIAEYGPSGPYWYETFAVSCQGPDGRCSRDAAEEWGRAVRQRKRGRIDPCGSAVIKGLGWSTTGGQGERDGGFFRDFAVRFSFEVKKFATQFAPGSTECVPK